MTKDPWHLIRRQCDHFTQAERDLIAAAFRKGVRAKIVARDLQCSTRAIHTHYARLRGGARNYLRGAEKYEEPQEKKPVDRAARFYHSNFEPG